MTDRYVTVIGASPQITTSIAPPPAQQTTVVVGQGPAGASQDPSTVLSIAAGLIGVQAILADIVGFAE